jgi:hypothetical protein
MQDLSSLAKGFPSYGASMAAGSTLTEKTGPEAALPGSASEQTNGVDAKHGTTPDLDIPAVKSYRGKSVSAAAGYSPNSGGWEKLK